MPIFDKGRDQKVASAPSAVGSGRPSNESSAQSAKSIAAPRRPASSAAVIGATISITGKIVGSEPLSVEGRVEGSIELIGNEVSVQPSGVVIADVTSESIVIAGEANGDLNGNEQVVLKKGARVQGNIVAPRVTLEDGARFNGRIDMGLDSAASADSGEAGSKVRPVAKPVIERAS